MNWHKQIMVTRRTQSTPLFYDGDCVFCTRTVALLQRLDWLHRVDFRNFRQESSVLDFPDFDFARAEREMLIWTGKGWLGGFEAWRFVSLRLPMLLAIYPLLHVPGIPWIGKRVYAWVAAHRFLFLGSTCDSGTCAAHLSKRE